MEAEQKESFNEALKFFKQGWEEASNAFEKFLSAFYIARNQKDKSLRLKWYETALEHAIKSKDPGVQSALPDLYTQIGACYTDLHDPMKAEENLELAKNSSQQPEDSGPFYHGTKADLKIGDFLTAGGNSNYQSDLKMNHIYFTALVSGAGLAASLAKGSGNERIYIVTPTGSFENDPNVTNKKFPGNPTRSYRSEGPLTIVGELKNWPQPNAQDVEKWKNKVTKNNGEIIN